MCLTQICKAILENNARVMPLSAPMTGEYGIHDLYLEVQRLLLQMELVM